MKVFEYKNILLIIIILLFPQVVTGQDKILVCATTPDLGSLVSEIGAEKIELTVFSKGSEDPHFVEPKPSFVKKLSQADLFIQMGMELEIGWAPVLLNNSRNPKIQRGSPGFVDASTVISPLGIPAGILDRSLGDVHPLGNPHYLLDPLNGLKVARLLKERLSLIQPNQKEFFQNQFVLFVQKLGTRLVGEELSQKYDIEKLAKLFEYGKIKTFLESQGESQKLSGWFGKVLPFYGMRVVEDHNGWLYFATRFGFLISGSMEPKPGIPPSTRHLKKLINKMKAEEIHVIFSSAYYNPKYAKFLADHTGAIVIALANQVRSRTETDNYLQMLDYNVITLTNALKGNS